MEDPKKFFTPRSLRGGLRVYCTPKETTLPGTVFGATRAETTQANQPRSKVRGRRHGRALLGGFVASVTVPFFFDRLNGRVTKGLSLLFPFSLLWRRPWVYKRAAQTHTPKKRKGSKENERGRSRKESKNMEKAREEKRGGWRGRRMKMEHGGPGPVGIVTFLCSISLFGLITPVGKSERYADLVMCGMSQNKRLL